MKLRAIQLFVVAVTVLGFIGYANSMTYVLGLLGHSTVPDTLKYTLLITNQEQSEITIKVMGVDNVTVGSVLTITGNDKDTISVDQMHGLNKSEIANKSLIVRSEPTDAKYTLQVFLKRTDNDDYTEGFMAIPFEHLLGTSLSESNRAYEYIVTTFCATSGFCQLAIAAGDVKANVKITYPNKMEEVTFCYGTNGDYLYKSSTASDSVIVLKPWHAVQIETSSDLTGTHIYSWEPITVFAGSHNVTSDDVTAHTIEQLPTSSHWGREYVVTNLGETGYGDIIKIASNWKDNEITMKGFPSFKLRSSSHVVTKRLGKGMTSYIKAKNPIQVVQISGLPYASNETSTLAMTVVPAINHRQINYTLSCDVDVKFRLFRKFSALSTENIQLNNEAIPNTNDDKVLVPYTGYEIRMFDETAETYVLTSSLPFSGIVKCGNAIMPLGTYITYPDTTSPDGTDGTGGTGGTCKEGLIGYSSRSPTGTKNKYQQSAHRITLDGTDDIVKLRAKFCGQLAVQFYEHMDSLRDSVMISLSKGKISLIECYHGSCNKTHYMNDTYNKDIDCSIDMGFYWFLQYESQGEKMFCLGTGPYPKKDGPCTDGIDIHIPNRFKRATLTSVVNSATFNYDLEPNDGCSNYISDWRCADALSNCSTVARSICTDPTYDGYMKRNCRKYCGHCYADSYGKKFRFVLPMFQDNTNGRCWIHVSGYSNIGNVAVGSSDASLTADHHSDNTKSFSIPVTSTDVNKIIVLVIADANVQVSVVYTADHTNEQALNMINTYPVYPVDTFGTEYMPFVTTGSDTFKTFVISEEDGFLLRIDKHNAVAFVSVNSYDLHEETPGISDNNNKLIYKSEKPFALFCGQRWMDKGIDRRNHFNQILPTGSWGTFYVVPAFSTSAVNRPFRAKLIMQAGTDNTIVTIDGDFDAIHPIFYQGDTIEQDISATAVYNVSSNYPIQLGLYLYDPTDEYGKLSSFHILPPSSNFLKTFNVAVPVDILKTLDFTTPDVKTYGVQSDLSPITGNIDISESVSDVTRIFNPGVTSGYGLTVVLGSNNRWMVMSGHSKITPQDETEICTITTSVVGDNVDNDCDGLNNEDTCYTGYGVYAEDMDLDGDFGEDCCCTETEPSILPKTTNTTCAASTKPDSQCWTVCSCPCSWAAKLETYTSWSEEEKKEAAEADIDKYQSALKINTDNLTSSTAQKTSADDSRQSAASIGYVGIAMFCIIFGGIMIMDLASLLRDLRIFLANIGDGYERMSNFVCRRN